MEDKTNIFVVRPLRHTTPMPSGNLYSKELVEGFVVDWKSKEQPMFCTSNSYKMSEYYMTDLSKVAGVVTDMYVDDEGLVVHFKLLETPEGQLWSLILESDTTNTFKLSPKLSITSKDGIVASAKLYGFELSNISDTEIADTNKL